jgi:tetratricopeptide (TPR) repeat protein
MPATYNGIGTHYYGKKNLQTRRGKCRSCGREGELSSYDTRLWFVVFFIPIIPLGRKRILDSCPACRRHYVSDLDKWETARQLEVSGAMEKFRSSPTPEGAVAVHQQMLGFHQIAEAAEFQKSMLAQYSDNAKLIAYLGAAHEHLGQRDQAWEFFKRALALRPDLPEARVGVARGHLRCGQLDEARKLLDFLEQPGAAQLYSLEPLESLARAYQGAGRHAEALDLFQKILQALPKVAEHAGFRKMVKSSEAALGRAGTVLPKQKFSWKRLVQGTGRHVGRPYLNARALLGLGVICALAALGFAISNEYIRHHRVLYLVNGYPVPATVKISGQPTVSQFKGLRSIVLPEGHYHAVTSGPVDQEFEFEVREGYFDRWFSSSLWLINVGGGALIQETAATYSRDPQPPTITFHFGQAFQRFGGVTHPFTPLPQSVQVQSGSTRTLVQLQVFKGQAADVFNYYQTRRNPAEALRFAEQWLGAHPEDEVVLQLYAMSAERQKQQARRDQYLRAGITHRPVRIEWHRLYQNMHDHPAEHAALVREYDDLLQAEPTSSALLYLRGRLETERVAARGLFKRAAEADPRNPFPSFALGFDRIAAGDWAGAKPLLAHAVEVDTRESGFGHWLFLARLGLNEAAGLEQELRQKLMREPLNYADEFNLIEVLAAQEKADETLTACREFASRFRSRYGSAGQDLINTVEWRAYYAIGDFEKLNSAALSDRSAAGRAFVAAASIELGEVDEAIKRLPEELSLDEREIFLFAIAVAYRLKGDEARASQWQSRGTQLLQNGNGDAVQAAAVLSRGSPPSHEEAQSIDLSPQVKAIIFTALSQQYPQARSELAGWARELNVERTFPYHLVRRVSGPPR